MSEDKSNDKYFSKETEPKRYYAELAELGLLDAFLRERFPEKYESDEQFRHEMQLIMMKHSSVPEPEIDKNHLKALGKSLTYFLEKTEKWRNLRH